MLQKIPFKEVVERCECATKRNKFNFYHTWWGWLSNGVLHVVSTSGAASRPIWHFNVSENRGKMLLLNNTTRSAYCYTRTREECWEAEGYGVGPFPDTLMRVSGFVSGGYQHYGGVLKQIDVDLIVAGGRITLPSQWNIHVPKRGWGGWSGGPGIRNDAVVQTSMMETLVENSDYYYPKVQVRFRVEDLLKVQVRGQLSLDLKGVVAVLAPYVVSKLDEFMRNDFRGMTDPNSRQGI